ncbi:hypothetical protein OED52_16530 [Rhodococcus sp. Z13]|uniref:Uncharacterized protein n=1 Tax=Rhodococcus sacchari TaxID=2962047 RepID=A0ACD4DE01_9NOCA|nr:hypothetical protein [Rhodococcus sp. Z13]UYP18249.1 hypothetical protein OED52_16530 [Rhodococcus sp. Z13]
MEIFEIIKLVGSVASFLTSDLGQTLLDAGSSAIDSGSAAQ